MRNARTTRLSSSRSTCIVRRIRAPRARISLDGGPLSAKPTLYATAGAPELALAAAGAWTAPHASELEALIDGVAADLEHGDASIDMHKVEAFDTYGAWLLERLVRERQGARR